VTALIREKTYTPGVNFINILRKCFLYKILAPKITKLCFGFEALAPKILYEKRAHITLMKLTQGKKSTFIEAKTN